MNTYTKFRALLLLLFIFSGLYANTFFRTYDLAWDQESCRGAIELSGNGNIVALRNDDGEGPLLEGIMFVNASGDSISFSYGHICPEYCVTDELDILFTWVANGIHLEWTDLYCNILRTVIITEIEPYSYGAEDIIQTLDGGFLTCGDLYVLKVDSVGVYEWDISEEFHGPWYFYVTQGADGSYLAGGEDLNHEYWCNISDEGIVQWEWTNPETMTYGYEALGTPDSGYAVTRSYSNILKISASGDSLWSYTSIHPEISYKDLVICGTDILACGNSWVDSFSVVTRLDSEGNLLWERVYHNCFIREIANTFDGGFLLSGSYPRYSYDSASLIIKTDSEGWWVGTGIEPEHYTRDLDIMVYPNPASSFSVLSFTLDYSSKVNLNIFDITGRCVLEFPEARFNPGKNEFQIEGLGSGIYFCRMISGDFTATQRFVVIE